MAVLVVGPFESRAAPAGAARYRAARRSRAGRPDRDTRRRGSGRFLPPGSRAGLPLRTRIGMILDTAPVVSVQHSSELGSLGSPGSHALLTHFLSLLLLCRGRGRIAVLVGWFLVLKLVGTHHWCC